MKKLLLLLIIPSLCFSWPDRETIECHRDNGCLYRLWIPHGWLITSVKGGVAYYPDEDHKWKI